jgi:chromosome segregation protein
MRFIKLRCLGFKSFVEPTEFLIEDGLTGIVGPNGCGKSNLVEALRWVMGESSYKNMRGSGMDDVIFSGSGNRPSRNMAEVALFLDNSERTAPAAFNDADELQVTRRIEREAGSAYRINGREVRAKDVQLLFADASTGARSPSMVGQGRIGELISAKPRARRALLEEAAGISGLHSRRHEAELRLRAADQNLERLEDVLTQLDSQLESLKRQARQANRYRIISASIREAEALLLHLKWTAAKAAEAQAQSALSEHVAAVGQRAAIQTEAAKEEAIAASHMPQLRDAEAKAAAAVQRLTIARNQIDEEAKRIEARRKELERRISHLDEDISRERRMFAENGEAIERLEKERAALTAEAESIGDRESGLASRAAEIAARVNESEERVSQLTAETARDTERRTELERLIGDTKNRIGQLSGQISDIETERAEIEKKIAVMAGPAQKFEQVELLEKRVADAEADAISLEKATQAARNKEQEFRASLNEVEAQVNRIETEARTLRNILSKGSQDLFPAIIEQIRVERGFEAALGAAFGEDLDLPIDRSAAAYWGLVPIQNDDLPLPLEVKPLAAVVKAPEELARCLAQTGIVAREDAAALQQQLKPGQRLVSVEGDLWRWDGVVAGAEAPTAAAQKLAQKNRLAELDQEAFSAIRKRDTVRAAYETARAETAKADENERASRENWRSTSHALGAARDELAQAERAATQFVSRRDSLDDAMIRLKADLSEAQENTERYQTALAEMNDISALEAELNTRRNQLMQERAEQSQIRAETEGFAREAQARERRLAAIADDIESWRKRAAGADAQIAVLMERRQENADELAKIVDAPDEMAHQRRNLVNQVEAAEAARREAADTLAEAESTLRELERKAKQAVAELSRVREEKIRFEERATSAKERRIEIETRIREELHCHPSEAMKLANQEVDAPLPEIGNVERNLEKLKAERERLGAVNLRAEAEQTEIASQRETLDTERQDLIEAIKRLRQGISELNKEGRARLLEAFDVVNEQFQRLFTHLFGGGTAELQLIESDDPLEAGLEIVARPPGKRPQTMTLLSGGEQALTAMALIFAVFLTNPAPICVLDEVDAPLDDHNVERFCNLMDEMVASTDTRFVIITHNPITMARMNRLFGVTMAERGVSQIVSVDLEQAERLREAV